MINLGLLTKYTEIKGVALPSLLLAQHISPILGTIMSVIMVLVIYNTVVGLMYAFAARFSEPFTTKLCHDYHHGDSNVHLHIYWLYFFNRKSLPYYGIIRLHSTYSNYI